VASSPSSLTDVGGVLLLSASDGFHGNELWRSDGTEAGTFLLQDINPGPRSSNPSGFTRVGDQIFFSADDGSSGKELWVLPASDLEDEPRARVKSPRGLPLRR
jgi:ELWxxDGT repeat protein